MLGPNFAEKLATDVAEKMAACCRTIPSASFDVTPGCNGDRGGR